MTDGWETVVGLEVHVQLLTKSKLFSPASTAPGSAQAESHVDGLHNTAVDVVDVGTPGALPVLNARVVELAARLGVALSATVHGRSVFARKHYFYPDLPKGYQISQGDRPIITDGTLRFVVPGEAPSDTPRPLAVHIVRAHLEEDAGKSVHDADPSFARNVTRLDYNRAGVPLLEVVTAPDLRSGVEAMACFRALRTLVMALQVCDGNLQDGSMRADANVSVRRVGDPQLGTRTEIKNLNSPRFLANAVELEAKRQIALLTSGGRVVQETRLYDPERKETRALRSKEDAHDYRYFPDPDLPAVEVSAALLAQVRAAMPELPEAMRERFVHAGLAPADAAQLASDLAVGTYFDEAVKHSAGAQGHAAVAVANWLLNPFAAALRARDLPLERAREVVAPRALGKLVQLVESGEITGKVGKDVLALLVGETGAAPSAEEPDDIVDRNGWRTVKDTARVAAAVAEVLAAHPAELAALLSGKDKVMGFFTGQVMRKLGGKSDPKDVAAALRSAVDKKRSSAL